MSQQRLLLFYSYIGTNYNGVQRIVPRTSSSPDFDTVQGIVEFGLNKILGTKDVALTLSSRTDSGVHAISTTAAFTYQTPDPLKTACPERLCENLNVLLERNRTEIRVNRIVQVEDQFHPRRVASRTYCYRLAVLKPNEFFTCPNAFTRTSLLPISDINRRQVIPQPFNPGAIFEACKIFLGTKNFRSFSKPGEGKFQKELEPEDYVKTIYRVSLTRVNNSEEYQPYHLDPNTPKFDFYDFHFQASGFLRRQVRKMVGVLLGIGSGKITTTDIEYMLENPHETNWNPVCSAAHSDGLFLKSVNYVNPPIIRGFLS